MWPATTAAPHSCESAFATMDTPQVSFDPGLRPDGAGSPTAQAQQSTYRPRATRSSRGKSNQLNSTDEYKRRLQNYSSSRSASVAREEHRFLADVSKARNDSIRRNIGVQGKLPEESATELLPVYLSEYAEDGPEVFSNSWGVSPAGLEDKGVTNIYAAVLGNHSSSLLNMVVPVHGRTSQMDRREANRLRSVTASLADEMDRSMSQLRASVQTTHSRYPHAIGMMPATPPDVGLPKQTGGSFAVPPPSSPAPPDYVYPDRVRAPNRGVIVQPPAHALAQTADKTAELVLASSGLAQIAKLPHSFEPLRSQSVPPQKGSSPALGQKGGQMERVRSRMVEFGPQSHNRGSASPGTFTTTDVEVARINRKAEELGLRPLGFDKDSAAALIQQELLDGPGVGPMAAYTDASRMYKHIFYQMFRQEIATCHERAEALSHLWFTIDNFLREVCSVAEHHHRNSIYESHHRTQLEQTLQVVSNQLKSALKAKQELEVSTGIGRSTSTIRSSASQDARFVDGQRVSRYQQLQDRAAKAATETHRDAETSTAMDGMTTDAAQVIRDAMAYTTVTPYKIDHREILGKTVGSTDAASDKFQYRAPGEMQLRLDARGDWVPGALQAGSRETAPLGVAEIGMQVRAQQQDAEVDRLKMAYLDLRQQNEILRADNMSLQKRIAKQLREAEESVMVVRQQLYRAQALLRSKVLVTLNGIRKHAADINNTLAYPNDPLRHKGASMNIPIGHASGNKKIFDNGSTSSASPKERKGSRVTGLFKGDANRKYIFHGTHQPQAQRSSYDPNTASYVKLQYDAKDVFDETLGRLDLAISEGSTCGAVESNSHRNHVKQILVASMEACMSHGMDFFCELFFKKLEESVRQVVEDGTGVVDDLADPQPRASQLRSEH